MRRDGPKLPGWLGTNFWSRTGGPLMWRNYDPAVVRDELEVLRRHQVTMTRSFFYWPDFHPEPDTVDDDKVICYLDFLDAHAERDMSTIPTFIVGHMSGENWDPPWRAGLLPADPAQLLAGRRVRLARLEHHRLRRPGRPGSLPAPPVRDALRRHHEHR